MSVTRIGVVLQPAWAWTSSVIVETSSTFGSKLQAFVEQTISAARAAFYHHLADVVVALLTPSWVLALVFAMWRFTADLGWTETFVIATGFFSHWQVWFALAIALKFAGASLQAMVRAEAKTSEEN
jgi:hypothetical protein